jgi:hypothetical protein
MKMGPSASIGHSAERATFRYAGFLVERVGASEFTMKAGDASGERVLRVSAQLVFLDDHGERWQPSRERRGDAGVVDQVGLTPARGLRVRQIPASRSAFVLVPKSAVRNQSQWM